MEWWFKILLEFLNSFGFDILCKFCVLKVPKLKKNLYQKYRCWFEKRMSSSMMQSTNLMRTLPMEQGHVWCTHNRDNTYIRELYYFLKYFLKSWSIIYSCSNWNVVILFLSLKRILGIHELMINLFNHVFQKSSWRKLLAPKIVLIHITHPVVLKKPNFLKKINSMWITFGPKAP